MDYRDFVTYLHKEEKLLDIDFYFADFAVRMAGEKKDSPLFLLAALVSGASSLHQEVCLAAERIATAEKLREHLELPPETELPMENEWLPQTLPEFLIFDGKNYYLHGNFQCREFICEFIRHRVSAGEAAGSFDPSITQLTLTAGQIETVRKSVDNPFLVISGGPGTGKTTILATILALRHETPERIFLAAPTGKAQARMQEALREELGNLNIPDERKKSLEAVQCSTVHRLLKYDPRTGFRHDRANPLDCDLLVIDECSMLSFQLLGQIFEALRPEASVILLGDYAQLASVQPGQIFADLCGVLSQYPRHLAKLTESKRFPADKGIARLRDQLAPELDAPQETAWECLVGNHEQLEYLPLPQSGKLAAFLEEHLYSWRKDGRSFFEADTLDGAWEIFESMRVLTPVVSGDYGSDALNEMLCKIFRMKDDTPGLPLLQRKNDYSLHVFNGDTGMLWFAGEDRQPLRRSEAGKNCRTLVFFPDGQGGWYGVERELLREADKAFAMTVHKAQGSGYGKVLFILPELEYGEGLLTRELIYTAVTRGKPEAVVVTERKAFCMAASRRARDGQNVLYI
jgi:exodeoxyribonuclease V alpha subunit